MRPGFLANVYTRLYASCVYDPFGILPRVGVVIQIVEKQDPTLLVIVFPFWLGMMLFLFPVTLVTTAFAGAIQSIRKSVMPQAAATTMRKERMEVTSEKQQVEQAAPKNHDDDHHRVPFLGGLVKRKTRNSG